MLSRPITFFASNKKSTFTQDHVHNVAVRPSLQRQVHDYLQCFYVLETDFLKELNLHVYWILSHIKMRYGP